MRLSILLIGLLSFIMVPTAAWSGPKSAKKPAPKVTKKANRSKKHHPKVAIKNKKLLGCPYNMYWNPRSQLCEHPPKQSWAKKNMPWLIVTGVVAGALIGGTVAAAIVLSVNENSPQSFKIGGSKDVTLWK